MSSLRTPRLRFTSLSGEMINEIMERVASRNGVLNCALSCLLIRDYALRSLYRRVEISTARELRLFIAAVCGRPDPLALYVRHLALHPRATAAYIDWDLLNAALEKMHGLLTLDAGRFVASPGETQYSLCTFRVESFTPSAMHFIGMQLRLRELWLGARKVRNSGALASTTFHCLETLCAPLSALLMIVPACTRLVSVQMSGPDDECLVAQDLLPALASHNGNLQELAIFTRTLSRPDLLFESLSDCLGQIQHLAFFTVEPDDICHVTRNAKPRASLPNLVSFRFWSTAPVWKSILFFTREEGCLEVLSNISPTLQAASFVSKLGWKRQSGGNWELSSKAFHDYMLFDIPGGVVRHRKVRLWI